MKIGIDIDDTTMITVNSMIKYADKYDVEILGRTGTNGNLGLIKNRYYLKVLYNWDDKTKYDFFNTFYKNVLEECVPMPNAPKVITKLKQEGNEISFVTARLLNIKNCNTEEITKKSLKDNNIHYDSLVINISDKLKYCKQNAIEIFIEDSFDTCKQLEENGIKTFLMTTKMNQDLNEENIERVNNWDEIYQKINRYIKLKKGK